MEALTDDQMRDIERRLREIDHIGDTLVEEAFELIKKRAAELHRRSSQNADCPSANAEPGDAQPVNAESEDGRKAHTSKSPLTVASSEDAYDIVGKKRKIRTAGRVAAKKHLRQRRSTAKEQAIKHTEDSDSDSNGTEEFNRNFARFAYEVFTADGEERRQRSKRRGARGHRNRKWITAASAKETAFAAKQ